MDDTGKLSPEEMTSMGLTDPLDRPVATGYKQTLREYIEELTEEVATLEGRQENNPTEARERRIETLKKRLQSMS